MNWEVIIEEALLLRLQTLDFDQTQIAWPNRRFEPTPGVPFIAPSLLPARAEQITLGDAGYNRHVGLLQILVVFPSDTGVTPANEVAGSLVALYKRGTVIERQGASIRISGPPWRSPAISSADWYSVPVNVPWAAELENP